MPTPTETETETATPTEIEATTSPTELTALGSDIRSLRDTSRTLVDTVTHKIDDITAQLDLKKQEIDNFIATLCLDDTVLEVGEDKDYPTPQAAWDYLVEKKLRGKIIIRLYPGEYAVNKIEFAHQPDASHVQVETVSDVDGETVIRFIPDEDGKSHGWFFFNVRHIRFSGKLKFVGHGADTHRAVYVAEHSFILFDEHTLSIDNCNIGVEVLRGGILLADYTTMTQVNGGVYVYTGGIGLLQHLYAQGVDRKTSSNGAICFDGGTLYTMNSQVKGFNLGYSAHRSNSLVIANQSAVEDCTVGFGAYGGEMFVHGDGENDATRGLATDCDDGVQANNRGLVYSPWLAVQNCNRAFAAEDLSYIMAELTKVSNCKEGYVAVANSVIRAFSTSGNLVNVPSPHVTVEGGLVRHS